MIHRETAVVCRMPILRGHHQRKRGLKPIRDRNDRVPLRHSQCATEEEIVLNVNEN
jgi:hypothetical protein